MNGGDAEKVEDNNDNATAGDFDAHQSDTTADKAKPKSDSGNMDDDINECELSDSDNRNDETECDYKTGDEGLMEFDQRNNRVLLADTVPAQSIDPESELGKETKTTARTHTNAKPGDGATTNAVNANATTAPTVNETTTPTAPLADTKNGKNVPVTEVFDETTVLQAGNKMTASSATLTETLGITS